jgi:hypothetical protein
VIYLCVAADALYFSSLAQVDEELRQVERDSIKDYISEAENLSTLHGNLKRCDEYLLKLEQVC